MNDLYFYFKEVKQSLEVVLEDGDSLTVDTYTHRPLFNRDFSPYAMVQLFLDRGAAVDVSNTQGACWGNQSAGKLYLDRGAAVDAADSDGRTALHCASSRSNNLDVLQLLLNRGALINTADHRGWTALHVAVSFCQYDTVQLLLKSGAAIDAIDSKGNSIGKFAHSLKIIGALDNG